MDVIRRRMAGASVHGVHLDGTGLYDVSIPADTRAVRLLTANGYAPGDKRRLGAAISGVVIDGVDAPLNDTRLAAGWHPCEGAWRWTDGAALVLTHGAKQIDVTVGALAIAAAA